MQDGQWIEDIHGEATWAEMAEFLVLWDTVSDFSPQQGISDTCVWRWSTSGQYTVKSAYHILCQGSIRFWSWKRI
jgi:hypothetical protein